MLDTLLRIINSNKFLIFLQFDKDLFDRPLFHIINKRLFDRILSMVPKTVIETERNLMGCNSVNVCLRHPVEYNNVSQ